jgi:hypothetical protein
VVDIPIAEHATDTYGVTLVNLGLFDLLRLRLSLGSGTWATRSPMFIRTWSASWLARSPAGPRC